jgi:hypothetical protein
MPLAMKILILLIVVVGVGLFALIVGHHGRSIRDNECLLSGEDGRIACGYSQSNMQINAIAG